VVGVLDATISDSGSPVTSLQILHLPLIMSLSVLGATSRDIDAFLEVSLVVSVLHVGCVVCLSSLVEGSLLISTEQVSVVITQVGIARVDVGDLGLRSSEGLGRGVATVPNVAHHDFKVSVSVDVGRHMSVVFNELFRGNSTIVGAISHHVEMVFKSAQPFSKYFIFSLLSRLNIRMASSVKFTLNIF
jgi:LEA14-like dessication related protein